MSLDSRDFDNFDNFEEFDLPDQKKKDPHFLRKLATNFLSQGRVWRYWQGGWYRYEMNVWRELQEADVKIALKKYLLKRKIPFTVMSVNNLMGYVQPMTYLDGGQVGEMPCFTSLNQPDPKNIIAYRNLLLDTATMQTMAHTQDWFSSSVLPYDYDEQATCPKWLAFLTEVLDGDAQRIALLQEWFGYCLTQDTKQQKYMNLAGPTRAGKGTISRIQERLVGEHNVTAFKLGELADQFGLRKLLGKQLAIIGEVHLNDPKTKCKIMEQFKAIIGEDAVDIEWKHINRTLNTHLTTRFTLCCNSLPDFRDPSGAMTERAIVIPFNRSFAGREDTDLTGKLAEELPGIANWALAGLLRLRKQGRFSVPEMSAEVLKEYKRDTSNALAFLQDCCMVSSDYAQDTILSEVKLTDKPLWVSRADVRIALQNWCQNTGKEMRWDYFTRDVRALLPKIKAREQKRTVAGIIDVYNGFALLANDPNPDKVTAPWKPVLGKRVRCRDLPDSVCTLLRVSPAYSKNGNWHKKEYEVEVQSPTDDVKAKCHQQPCDGKWVMRCDVDSLSKYD